MYWKAVEQARAQKKAFVDASKVRCSDCEGGYSYDAWAHFFVVKGGDYSKKFSEMLIALKPGQGLKWKGSRFNGVVQATGEHPIGPYPCRQYHWTLKDGSKVAAEREGLYCEFKGDYAATARLQEILRHTSCRCMKERRDQTLRFFRFLLFRIALLPDTCQPKLRLFALSRWKLNSVNIDVWKLTFIKRQVDLMNGQAIP